MIRMFEKNYNKEKLFWKKNDLNIYLLKSIFI